MREIVRPVVAALSIACLAALMSSSGALAQAKQQMAPAPAAPMQPIPTTFYAYAAPATAWRPPP